MHFRDAGLPLLFLEAFVLMGAFVTLFNYIGYRLLAAPYHLDQASVGLLAVVYLSGIYSSAKVGALADKLGRRSEEHTSELQSLMRISYADFCLNNKKTQQSQSPDT